MAITLDGTNGILSPDFEPSSSTTPTNGLFLPATNALGFATNSTERLRLDASGNLGLGVTPSAWGSNFRALQIGPAASFATYNGTGSDVRIYCNAFLNSSSNPTYIQSSLGAGAFQIANNEFRWYTAPSGTAGNAISFTQAMTLSAAGGLSVGTTSDAGAGNIWATNSIYVGDGSVSNNAIARAAGTGTGFYFPAANTIGFTTNATERARIDSSGNLLVGTTSSSARLYVVGPGGSSYANGLAWIASNAASDSTYTAMSIQKYDNVTTTSQKFVTFLINQGAAASGYITANGANAATFTSSSDARLKENITSLPNQLANICALKPSEFDYKDGSGHQIGFIAQEMEEVYPDCVAEDGDGMLMISGWSKTEARLVKAIQELNQRLEALENK